MLQAKVYQFLPPETPDPWPPLLARRFETLIPGEAQFNYGAFANQEFAKLGKKLGKGNMMVVIKTLAKSWSTTERYREDHRFPCIFGCEDKDDLRHYCACPVLWNFINSVECAPTELWDRSLATRACFVGATMDDLKRIVVAFKSYHAIRLGHPEAVLSAVQNGKFDHVHELLSQSVRYFCDELALYRMH